MPGPLSWTRATTRVSSASTTTAVTARRVLDRVVDEVRQHLADLLVVADDGRDGARALDGDVATLEAGSRCVHDRFGRGAEIDTLLHQPDASALELRRDEDLVDDRSEPVRLRRDDREQPCPLLRRELD